MFTPENIHLPILRFIPSDPSQALQLGALELVLLDGADLGPRGVQALAEVLAAAPGTPPCVVTSQVTACLLACLFVCLSA